MFNVSFTILARLLLPVNFRSKSALVAWLYAAVAPIVSLYERFMLTRASDLLRESINSTIPRLEYLLNYTFYSDGLTTEYDNRIRIVLEKNVEVVKVYLGGVMQVANEEKPLYLNKPQYIYTYAEAGVAGVDFSVIVPKAAQPYDVARMTSLLRTYALPDKTFTIINQ